MRKHVMNVHKGKPVHYIDLRTIMNEANREDLIEDELTAQRRTAVMPPMPPMPRYDEGLGFGQ